MTKTKSPFTSDTYAFLNELERNNNRGWFNANKDRYEKHVKEPMLQFIGSIQEPLSKVSRHVVADPSPVGGSMFRIYRDTRFTPDKTPYKTHVAAQFRHVVGRDAHAPAFYLHLGSRENIIGGGIWRPPATALGLIRARIVERPGEWEKVIKNRRFRQVLQDVGGDALKNPPRGYVKDDPHIEYIKHVDFVAGVDISRMIVTRAGFKEYVIDVFKAMSPLMKFLCDALGFPW